MRERWRGREIEREEYQLLGESGIENLSIVGIFAEKVESAVASLGMNPQPKLRGHLPLGRWWVFSLRERKREYLSW